MLPEETIAIKQTSAIAIWNFGWMCKLYNQWPKSNSLNKNIYASWAVGNSGTKVSKYHLILQNYMYKSSKLLFRNHFTSENSELSGLCTLGSWKLLMPLFHFLARLLTHHIFYQCLYLSAKIWKKNYLISNILRSTLDWLRFLTSSHCWFHHWHSWTVGSAKKFSIHFL